MNYAFIEKWEPYAGQEFDPATSQVVPDQSMSLQEILERFTLGEEIGVGQKTFYDEDDENEIDWDKF